MTWGNQYFYHQIIRKMVVVFGSIFNDMSIERTDTAGNVTTIIKVPIQYSVKEKMLARLQDDPDIDRPYSALLPRLSFEITDIVPDRNRSIPAINRMVTKSSDPNKLRRMYTPAPYDIKFQLHVYVKNQEDGTKLIEQILPFFRPDWTANIELINDGNMVESRDIPFILNSISNQDVYSDDFKQRRILIYTLDFTCHTYFYGPIQERPIIKFSTVDVYMGMPGDPGANTPFEEYTVQPGLTANGQPTTNVAESVAWSVISIDDDYGFCETLRKL